MSSIDVTATPIQIFYSTTTGNAPTAAQLAPGELAVNLTDKRLWVGGFNGTPHGTGATPIPLLYGPALSSVTASSSVNNFTLTAAAPASGNVAINLAYSSVANAIVVSNPAGTGLTTLPYGTDSTYFLASGGSGSLPTWIKLTGTGGQVVQEAANLAGGAAGGMPYQSASGTTMFVTPGTAGQVLQSNGTGAPTFVNQSSLNAGQASNLNGGATNSIPYQSAAGTTTFLGQQANSIMTSNASGTPQWTAQPLPVPQGGTGRNSFANTTSLLLSGTTTTGVLTALDGGTGAGAGSALISQGTNAPPVYSKDITMNSVSIAAGDGYTWKFQESAGKITAYLNNTAQFSVDASGNAIFRGNVTAFGTP